MRPEGKVLLCRKMTLEILFPANNFRLRTWNIVMDFFMNAGLRFFTRFMSAPPMSLIITIPVTLACGSKCRYNGRYSHSILCFRAFHDLVPHLFSGFLIQTSLYLSIVHHSHQKFVGHESNPDRLWHLDFFMINVGTPYDKHFASMFVIASQRHIWPERWH